MVDEEGGGQNSKALLLRLNNLFIATGHPPSTVLLDEELFAAAECRPETYWRV